METNKLAVMAPRIEKDTDVYISMFGELKIATSKGVLTEQELKSPKIVRMLVYLLLSQKVASPRRPYRLSDENSRRQDPEVQHFLHS